MSFATYASLRKSPLPATTPKVSLVVKISAPALKRKILPLESSGRGAGEKRSFAMNNQESKRPYCKEKLGARENCDGRVLNIHNRAIFTRNDVYQSKTGATRNPVTSGGCRERSSRSQTGALPPCEIKTSKNGLRPRNPVTLGDCKGHPVSLLARSGLVRPRS